MINGADTVFMLVAAALVMFMTPGLAFFYGGLVRPKNVLSTMFQSIICLGIVSVLWCAFGYSWAFGPDVGGIIGNFTWAGLSGVGFHPGPYAPTIPHLLFCTFQLMFAIITPALVTGAFAERMRFSAYVAFVILWSSFVYFPLCHWIWGGGWFSKMGVLDFAGGMVIHLNSGVAALVAALVLGPRLGYKRDPFTPHSLPLVLIGVGLLWFGWFGFNGGSALSAGPVAVLAFFNTHLAAAVALVSWVVLEWWTMGKPTLLGAGTGAVAGLATVTNAAGFVSPASAAFIGLAAGVICFGAVMAKERLGYDDSLDVVGVHGIGGLVGALATGLLASKAMNPAGSGLFDGNPHQMAVQMVAALVTVVFSAVMTFVIFKVIDVVIGLRVDRDEEIEGLDLTQHSETAYTMF